MEIIVFHVQLQEIGTLVQINVFATHQKIYGLELIASVLLVHSEIIAFLVQLQETGILIKNNAFVEIL